MKEAIQNIFNESIKVKEQTVQSNLDSIVEAVAVISASLKQGGKVILFGNGGSAADSQHIAAELIGRFQEERESLAALALTTDTSALTALANDYGYDVVFSRQIQGLGKPEDVAIGISTSGGSKNVIEGLKEAKKKGMKTISLTGCGGGDVAKFSEVKLIVPSDITARIQESHICLAHTICELVEKNFVNSK